MSGNVYEWCWDRYGSITTTTPATGASFGSDRVYRGGSWGSSAADCSVTCKCGSSPYYRDDYLLGFRVVRNAQ